MSERASLQRQIEDLSAHIQEIEDRIDDRNVLSIRQQVWLAKTVGQTTSEAQNSEEKEYPSGASSTFGVAFRRPKFEEQIGDQALAGPFGSDEPQRYALTVPKRFVQKGTDTMVVEIDGQFYFLPSGREVLLVQLDDDLDEAAVVSNPDGVECIDGTHQPATIWAVDDSGLFCPTGEKLDAPEGVYNFQTDQKHFRVKAGGDPNLLLVYREAQSGKFVPECPTCGDSPLATVSCVCLSDENLCRVFLHFRDVRSIDPNVRPLDAGGVPTPGTWPTYCSSPSFGIGEGEICGRCTLWNRVDGWELLPELGPISTNDCRFGIIQSGCNASNCPEPFQETELPCQDRGDASWLIAAFTCPSPTDTTGSAEVEVRIRGCLLFQLTFRDILYLPDTQLHPDVPAQQADNRVSLVNIPTPIGSRCACLLDTTRNNLFQGNFDADTGTPNLQHGSPAPAGPAENVPGHNYIVSVAGTHDFGSGGVAMVLNDTVVYDDLTLKWVVIPPNAIGGVNTDTFIPIEIVNFIDSDGCDWSQTLTNARINLTFKTCET